MESEPRANFGYFVSGLVGIHWLYKELSFYLKNREIAFIKSKLRENHGSAPSEGDIVFLTGNLMTSGSTVVKDETFGISIPAIKLERKVEMLQWHREKNQYLKRWSEYPISSQDFETGLGNPKFKIFQLENTSRGDLVVDGVKVNPRILKIVKNWQQVKGNYMGNGFNQFLVDDQVILHDKDKEFTQPDVGSYRITHRVIPQFLNVSLIGQFRSGKVSDYRGIFLAKEGTYNYHKLIEEYQADSVRGVKIFRVLSFCGMAAGFIYGKNYTKISDI